MIGWIRRRRKPKRMDKRHAILTAARDSGWIEGYMRGADVSVLRLQKILNGDHDIELERLRGRIDVLEHELAKLKRERKA